MEILNLATKEKQDEIAGKVRGNNLLFIIGTESEFLLESVCGTLTNAEWTTGFSKDVISINGKGIVAGVTVFTQFATTGTASGSRKHKITVNIDGLDYIYEEDASVNAGSRTGIYFNNSLIINRDVVSGLIVTSSSYSTLDNDIFIKGKTLSQSGVNNLYIPFENNFHVSLEGFGSHAFSSNDSLWGYGYNIILL